ncbi:MAG: hypothetical protein H6Q33_5001 [Deltaproteobacteria bacterium]|nr:hypothetical protein [Deltaproteobacteria bacterium]
MLNVSGRIAVVMFCLALAGLQPRTVLGADTASGKQDTTQTAPAEKAAQPNAAGCPYMESGSCCAECQGTAAQAPKGEAAAPMDCPCKRAKQASKES